MKQVRVVVYGPRKLRKPVLASAASGRGSTTVQIMRGGTAPHCYNYGDARRDE